jgi:hypothetical protein
MQTGIEFLTDRVDEAVAQHAALLQSIIEHEVEADDQRYRDFCTRHVPRMREHQRMIEELRASLGSGGDPAGPTDSAEALRRVAGTAFAAGRSLADAPRSDYSRLVGDLSMVRHLEVTFKLFRDAGRELRLARLAHFGEIAERHHDEYSGDAKRLLLQMFVERAQGAADVVHTVIEQSRRFSGMS